MKKNIAILGCGRISRNHIIAIANNFEDANLVALCDLDIDKANIRKKEYEALVDNDFLHCEVKLYTDYKIMIDENNIDIIGISTESGYHYEHTMYMLNNNINVLVEKPMALEEDHAIKMIDLAEKKHLNLGVCFQNRFNPPIQLLRQAIDEGKFGKIFAITANIYWNRGKGYYEQAPWRGTHSLDGGALMNQCIHNIDLLQWMSNSIPIELNAMLSNFNHDYLEVEDYGSIQIKFENGIIGNIEGTVAVYPSNYKETLLIIGEKGTVEIGGLAVNDIKQWIFDKNLITKEKAIELTKNDIGNIYGNGHTPLYKDFINSLIELKDSYISGKEGIKALKIIIDSYKKSGVNYDKYR